MREGRAVAAVLVVVFALASATAYAAGAFKTGDYAGKTDKVGVVTFTVSKGSVKDLLVSGKWMCGKSTGPGTGGGNWPLDAAITLKGKGSRRRGVFDERDSARGARIHLKGRIKGSQASGTVEGSGRFRVVGYFLGRPAIRASKNGALSCTLPQQRWRASLNSGGGGGGPKQPPSKPR